MVAPHVPWRAYFAAMNHPELTSVDLNLPKFTAVFDAQLATVPIDTWQAYLRSHLLTAFADALPKRFDRATFAFYSTVINGVKVQRPRWKRCIDATDTALPDPLGKVYVAQEFPPSAKVRVLALVNDLQATLHDDIATLPWMSPATRKYAEIKLAAYTKKIGYPDHWIDYSAVTFAPGESFLADRFATQNFNAQLDLNRIGKPTDRTLWGLSAPTVNAYYNPSNNEIVFPAGILQTPLYDPDADDAVVYGASGAIIGHEMTHGFDDQGRKYDAKGDLGNWWTPADAARFSQRAQCIVDQFNGYYLSKGLHENGRLVQGEATADLGGATIAFRAFERTAEYRAHVKIGGYTPEQRFFLAYAQIWRGLITPAAARNYALTDPHPANRYRILGTLGNMPEFQTAFACARNAPMIRKDRCQIW
jgi:putative endopeptidase